MRLAWDFVEGVRGVMRVVRVSGRFFFLPISMAWIDEVGGFDDLHGW